MIDEILLIYNFLSSLSYKFYFTRSAPPPFYFSRYAYGHWFGNWSQCCWCERCRGLLDGALHVLVRVFGDAYSGSHLLLRSGLQNYAELVLNLFPAWCYKLRNDVSLEWTENSSIWNFVKLSIQHLRNNYQYFFI